MDTTQYVKLTLSPDADADRTGQAGQRGTKVYKGRGTNLGQNVFLQVLAKVARVQS